MNRLEFPHLPARSAVELDQRIKDRWLELRQQGEERLDAYYLAKAQILSEVDSVKLGDVRLQAFVACPCCGQQIQVDLAGGQVIAKKE